MKLQYYFLFFIIIPNCLFYHASTVSSSSIRVPLLTPYDGRPLPFSLTFQENQLLERGQAIVKHNKDNKSSGDGFVLQDVHAPVHFCINQIKSIDQYAGKAPNVKNVREYAPIVRLNQSDQQPLEQRAVEFTVRVLGIKFQYYLLTKYNPKYNTFTWTLDYNNSLKSDFADNVGHWQVMEHPTLPDQSRILYTTKVVLPSWIPSAVITALTKTVLRDSVAWVKRETEKEFHSYAISNKNVNNISMITDNSSGNSRSSRLMTRRGVKSYFAPEIRDTLPIFHVGSYSIDPADPSIVYYRLTETNNKSLNELRNIEVIQNWYERNGIKVDLLKAFKMEQSSKENLRQGCNVNITSMKQSKEYLFSINQTSNKLTLAQRLKKSLSPAKWISSLTLLSFGILYYYN